VASTGALKHIRNYASAGVLAAMAGIITFPLLTRSLTVAEYGILGLITSSLTLFIAFGKLGMQHSIVRYYAQIKNDNLSYSSNEMTSTVFMLFLVFASVTTGLWLLLGYAVLPSVSQFSNISTLYLIASGIVFLRLLGSSVTNFLRAQQRSAVVGFTQILGRYLYLVLVLVIMFLGKISVGFVLLSMLLAELVAFAFAGRKFWPDFRFKLTEVTASLAKSMLLYGMPLMMLESLGLVMRLSDRYIIQALLGENALGMYSASYNLASYLDLIIIVAMVQALKPFYMQLWETEGAEKTKSFLSNGLHTYLVLGIPLVTLFSLVSPYLLSFLASDKYAPGTIIIPFVAFSILLEGSMHFLAAGLYIKKDTKVLMIWGVVATVLNLGLNILLIPIYGILAAAVVTIVCYLVFVIGITYKAFDFLPIVVKPRIPLLLTLVSVIVYGLLFKIDFGGDVSNLLCKGLIGGVLLCAAIVVVDPRIREWIVDHIRPPKAGTVK